MDDVVGDVYDGANTTAPTRRRQHDGANTTALDFGTADFSFSYWSYDDTSDGNTRGPRIFDFLDGTDTGVQLGTNATNIYNLRVDTSDGGTTISNNTLTTLE